MQVVLLCAGMGTRLGSRTEALPKTLLDLNGKAVLDHILKSVDLDEISDIIVVGGFEIGKLKDHLEKYKGKPLRIVENPDYRDGSVLTVAKAMPFIEGDFIIMNGDHIHPREMVHKFISEARGIACATDRDRILTDDDMKVKLDASGAVSMMDKKLSDYDCGYIGVTFYAASHLDLYRDYIQITLARHGYKSNVEKIVQCLADDGYKPGVVDLSGFGWLEIDNEGDYRHALEQIAVNPYLKRLV